MRNIFVEFVYCAINKLALKYCYIGKVGEIMAKASEYRNKWISETFDRINLTVPKGEKDKIKAHADSMGESVNGFINRAIENQIENDKK